jgi:nucleotide-binding universal stress UspA family protein
MTGGATGAYDGSAAARADRPGGLALVVGHDGHPASNAALRAAIDLAQRLDAHLHIVHSVTLDDYGIDPDTETFEQECDRSLGREREAISNALSGTAVRWTYHEERGDPASRLAQLASELDAAFIIVGASSPGMLHHMFDSSVPRRLLHRQGHPIVVVPPAPPA